MPTYNRGKLILLDASCDWAGDDIRSLLVDATYVFDADHNFVADVAADEIVDATYGRVTIDNRSVSEDDAGDKADLEGDPADYGGLDNVTPAGIVLFKFVTNDGDSPLIGFSSAGFGAAAVGTGYVVNPQSGSIWLSGIECP